MTVLINKDSIYNIFVNKSCRRFFQGVRWGQAHQTYWVLIYIPTLHRRIEFNWRKNEAWNATPSFDACSNTVKMGEEVQSRYLHITLLLEQRNVCVVCGWATEKVTLVPTGDREGRSCFYGCDVTRGTQTEIPFQKSNSFFQKHILLLPLCKLYNNKVCCPAIMLKIIKPRPTTYFWVQQSLLVPHLMSLKPLHMT